ncbi:MAG: hypothetical protein CMJ52_08410 [Planctomycetaceae bacterium]|nr:hypothetical protein [Planctomycetaceae bacterium]
MGAADGMETDPARDGGWPVRSVTIDDARLDVFLLDLDASAPDGQDHLTAEERHRAERLHRARDRIRFASRRRLLRRILAARLELPCESIAFEIGPRGKPRLRGPLDERLRFNTSHRGRWFVIACGTGRSIGVDLELRRRIPDGKALAERWLSPRERGEAARAGHDLDDVGFLRVWCRKEAVMKATGLGLSLDSLSFSVPTGPNLHDPAIVEFERPRSRTLHLVDVDDPEWPRETWVSICVEATISRAGPAGT